VSEGRSVAEQDQEDEGRFYRNDGNGQLADLTSSLGLSLGWYGAWGDYDNDGRPDLHTERGLYWNDGAGHFESRTGSAYPGWGQGSWIDYDNDGYLDWFTALAGQRHLLRNDRDGTVSAVSLGSLTSNPQTDGGAVWADVDNNGFLDVVITSRMSNRPNELYRNEGNENRWLLVKLVGTCSNRSAIGAKVRAQATIWGSGVQQLREISGAPNVGEIRAHFGLGDATKVDLLRIEWASGIVQELKDVAANQILTVTEHQEGATNAPSLAISNTTEGTVQLTATGQADFRYVFEASTDLAQWTKLAVRTNLTGTVSYMPPTSAAAQRFYRVAVP
jgi:hypothetical protein